MASKRPQNRYDTIKGTVTYWSVISNVLVKDAGSVPDAELETWSEYQRARWAKVKERFRRYTEKKVVEMNPVLQRGPQGEPVFTLRDLFAGQALIGFTSNPEFADSNVNAKVWDCWRMADLMLSGRVGLIDERDE